MSSVVVAKIKFKVKTNRKEKKRKTKRETERRIKKVFLYQMQNVLSYFTFNQMSCVLILFYVKVSKNGNFLFAFVANETVFGFYIVRQNFSFFAK